MNKPWFISLLIVFTLLPSLSHARIILLAMNANVDGLKHTGNDRRKIVDSFQHVYRKNIDVVAINNVTRQEYMEAMAWLKRTAQPEDHIIIYFSGHGIRIVDDSGDESDGYDEALVGYGRNGQLDYNELILDDDIAHDLRYLKVKYKTLIMDTCHAGGMNKAFRQKGDVLKYIRNPDISRSSTKSPNFSEGTGSMSDYLRGSVLIAASSEKERAIEFDRAGGGLFTDEFSYAFKRTGSIRRAFDQAKEAVGKLTNYHQTPRWYAY